MKTIAQRDLRNNSGQILRRAERGQSFTVTVGGRPVAMLQPIGRLPWCARATYAAVFGTGGADRTFFRDLARLGRDVQDVEDPWVRRGQ
jgi:prevent-host-death family protein